jgi:hypothetical protein
MLNNATLLDSSSVGESGCLISNRSVVRLHPVLPKSGDSVMAAFVVWNHEVEVRVLLSRPYADVAQSEEPPICNRTVQCAIHCVGSLLEGVMYVL